MVAAGLWAALFSCTAMPVYANSAETLSAAVEYGIDAAVVAVVLAAGLSAWNAALRRRVAAGTARLTATLELLAASNAELDARRREMGEIITGIDLAKDCITIIDADERILFTNRASLELAGLSNAALDDIRGKRVDEFQNHPDFLRVVIETGAAVPAKEFWEGEIEWVRPKDGKSVFYDIRRSRLPTGGYVVVSTDVTERKRAERALAMRERETARILAAVSLTGDALSVTDEHQRLLFANRAAIEMAGLPSEITDVRGLRWTDFQTRQDYRAATVERERALETIGYWEGKLEWIRPIDGRSVFLWVRHSKLPGGGSVISSTDITEQRRMEEERRQRDLRQAQSSKMEALGQLAGGVAHDFNNLLGAILGFSHFIVEDTDPASPQHHFAQRIVTAGQRGRSLVQQILAFSRRTTVAPVPVPVADIVAETGDLLRAALPSTTQLTLFVGRPDAAVLADKGQLSQVLINLCVNASDALGGEPGQVGIGVGRLDRDRPELVHLPACHERPSPTAIETWSDDDGTLWLATGGLPVGPCISVVISDSGAGIPADLAPRIFDPFFTTKEKGRGTGLGLAVIHAIVCEHGGAILVKTCSGAGSAFEVILPAAPTVMPTVAELPAPPPLAQVKATVLLVDDDADFCDMAKAALERLGHEVVATNDPREALQAIKDDPGLWNLLVTDQTMPHLKGRDLVVAAKAVAPNLRCILCTGYSNSVNEAEALAVGAQGFLAKPIDLNEFTAMVGRLLGS